jgi:hypothetical protein
MNYRGASGETGREGPEGRMIRQEAITTTRENVHQLVDTLPEGAASGFFRAESDCEFFLDLSSQWERTVSNGSERSGDASVL